jgi:hypothetical protein
MIKPDQLPAFVGLVVFVAAFGATYALAKYGHLTARMRPLKALEALPEAMGRAAEVGRPVVCTIGPPRVQRGDEVAMALAGLAVLRHVCKLAGELKVKVLSTTRYAEWIPAMDAAMRGGYLESGNPGLYNKDTDLQYMGSEGVSWHLGTMGLIARSRAASTIMVGFFGFEAMLLTEASSAVGAVQIGGTATMKSLPFLVAGCDYSLIGEEIYAAGAYLSQNNMQGATIFAQDIAKFAALLLILVGSIASTVGFGTLAAILSR